MVEDADFLNQLLGGQPHEELKSLHSGRQPPFIEVDDAESRSKEQQFHSTRAANAKTLTKRFSVTSKGPRKFGSIGGVHVGAFNKNSDNTSGINFFEERRDDAGYQVTINTKDYDFKSDMLQIMHLQAELIEELSGGMS